MSQFLRQATSGTVILPPLMTSAGTAYTTCPATSGVATAYKNGTSGSMATSGSAGNFGCVNTNTGEYFLKLSTVDSDTAGAYRVSLAVPGYLPTWRDYTVLPGDVYDALMGTASKWPISGALSAASGAIASAVWARPLADNTSVTTMGGNQNLLTDIDNETDRIKDGGDLDNIIDAIKSKTDNIPTNPATSGEAEYIAGFVNTLLARVPSTVATSGALDAATRATSGRIEAVYDPAKAAQDYAYQAWGSAANAYDSAEAANTNASAANNTAYAVSGMVYASRAMASGQIEARVPANVATSGMVETRLAASAYTTPATSGQIEERIPANVATSGMVDAAIGHVVTVQDILEADVDVDTTAKTITWKHKDTHVTLFTKTYDDSGTTQGVS